MNIQRDTPVWHIGGKQAAEDESAEFHGGVRRDLWHLRAPGLMRSDSHQEMACRGMVRSLFILWVHCIRCIVRDVFLEESGMNSPGN